MDGSSAFDDHHGFDYSNNHQPLPSLNSTLLKQNHQHQDSINAAHSIQMMLGLQQQQDMFGGMEYKGSCSPQKLDGSSPMHHHDLGPLFQHPGMEVISPVGTNGMKRKNEDIVLIQSQQLTSTENPTTTTGSSGGKKNDKKKNDNNGVKKKKTR